MFRCFLWAKNMVKLSPFMFFTDFKDKELIDAIRDGTKKRVRRISIGKAKFLTLKASILLRSQRLNWQNRYLETGKKIAVLLSHSNKTSKKLPIFHSEAERQIKQISNTMKKFLFIHKQSEDSQAV